ncbi:MAG: hypothetical protein D6715_09845 [Calditrichaeota bacterium]|nr:MAG: hypothetical protein D6715_09845 [Calditrichota bacterium]
MQSFDYQREFFRRPFWNPSDRLYFRILLVVAFAVLVQTLLAVHYFSSPVLDATLNKKIKHTYISKLVSFYQAGPRPRALERNPVVVPEPPSEEEITRREVQKIEDLMEKTKAARFTPEQIAGIEPVKRRKYQRKIQPLVSAGRNSHALGEAVDQMSVFANPAPEVSYSPLQPLKKQEELYRQKVKALAEAAESHQESLEESFTDFQILKGYRDTDQLIAVARANNRFVKHCVEKYLRYMPDLHGSVVVQFTIHPQGHVVPGSVRILEASIADPRVVDCIKKTVRRWKNFPKVAYEMGEYTMTQKYIF